MSSASSEEFELYSEVSPLADGWRFEDYRQPELGLYCSAEIEPYFHRCAIDNDICERTTAGVLLRQPQCFYIAKFIAVDITSISNIR